MIDLGAVTSGLRETEPGFWVANGQQPVSYPEEGHSGCFEVEGDSYWFAHRNAIVASVVGMFPPSGAIVDVGGGNGFVSVGLQEAGFETVVVEPGSAGARNALERGMAPVVQATFESAGFLPRSLSAVGLFDVVEHIELDSAFLRGIHEALRPGGLVYVTVPAAPVLWSDEDVEAGHFRRYTRSSIARVLVASGYDVVFRTYFFWLLPIPILLFRSMPSRLGRKKASSSISREHRVPTGPVGTGLTHLLAAELRRLSRGKGMPFGASIILVARKR